MSPNTDAGIPARTSGELHLVCGSGGSRAILGSSGAILACHLAGINNWQTLGGASGGSIPTLMLAGGVHPTKIVRYTIETDFASLLTRHGSLFQILLAYFMKERYEKTRPRRGVMGSEKVGEFVESFVPAWPGNYWTVAAHRDNQWLFTADGVFEYTRAGKVRVISRQPAPVGIAIRASCAVPGIIDAAIWNGNYLFDGALTMDGRCPVRVPKRHFGARSESILALDVGEDNTRQSRWVRMGWKILCGGNCVPQVDGDNPAGSEGVVLIKPAPMEFRSLQFTLSSDQKWQAVMSGFLGAIQKLEAAGLLTGLNLEKALVVARAFDEIQRTSTNEGELASRTEAMLAGHGLY
jgi:predicted acylesterase/phospholipase RssA